MADNGGRHGAATGASPGPERGTVATAAGPSAALESADVFESVAGLLGADRHADALSRLREDKESARAAKKRLTQLIRNEKRKRSRLMKKSQKLSNMDLLQVLQVHSGGKARASTAVEEARAAEDERPANTGDR